MTGEFLWINIPFMVLFFGLWVGIPMWMIFKRPDRAPRESRAVPQAQRAYEHAYAARRRQPAARRTWTVSPAPGITGPAAAARDAR